jgi:phenylacetate-coenzyme A ligase PaaK-like adenylate-forming protein
MSSFPLEEVEKCSTRELQSLQLERLRWSLSHAYDNVARYRQKFDAAGVRPSDLRGLGDLSKFPFTTKIDLRETYPFGMFAVPMERIVRIHASSGTTGKPTVVGYTAKDIDTWSHVMARSMRAAGARPGDKVHVAYGYGLFTGGLGAHYGAERLGLAVIPLGGGMTERQVQLIADFKPEIIMVTPSYMLAIADDMLIIRGVNVFPSQIEELILKEPGLAPHYVLELTKHGPMDHLTVLVEGEASATSRLQHSIKSTIGISADVKIGAVERSVGKAKRVIDKRPK